MRRVAVILAILIGAAFAAFAATHRHSDRASFAQPKVTLVSSKLCRRAAARRQAFALMRAQIRRVRRVANQRYARSSQAWSNLMTATRQQLRLLASASFRARMHRYYCSP